MLISIALMTSSCWKSQSYRAFKYCLEGSPSSFNPQTATDGDTFDASSRTVYNRLVEFKPGTTMVKPSLAKKWEVLENGRRLRFYLRKNVKFHSNGFFKPSRDFNANDVLFSFKRMRDSNHPFHNVGDGTYKYFESLGMTSIVEDVVKVNDFVVDFKLKKPEAPFISTLAMDFASVLSKEYADYLEQSDQKEFLDFKPIGTGPFKYDRYIEGEKIFFTRFSEYFKKPAKIENLIIKVVPNGGERVKMLLAGQCDFIKSPPLERISELIKNPTVKVIDSQAMNLSYLAMNTEVEKLKSKKIRTAISKSLNRLLYIERVYFGRAEVAHLPLPPNTWASNTNIEKIKYNKKKAQKILKESLNNKRLSVELWTLPIARPYLPNGKLLAEYIKNDLYDVGIDVKLVTYDWISFLNKISKGEHEMVLYGWTGDNGDPDNFLNNLLSCSAASGGNNLARFCNKEYDESILKAKAVTDIAIRKEEYTKALKIFRKEMPLVPLAHSKIYKVMSSKVENYISTPFGTESFENIYLTDWKKNEGSFW